MPGTGARCMIAVKWIRRNTGHPAVLTAILFGVQLLRCWPRLVSPQVWAEDGLLVLSGFIDRGWLAFFEPVNGYWQFIGKLIAGLSLGVSIYHFPLLSSVLTCIFSALVGLAVAVAPTMLRGRFLCALAIFLVPTDPEVFGLPLYAFWWAGLLLFLLVLWDEKRTGIGWRSIFLLVGGLSSPVIALAAPLLYYRAFKYRDARGERWLAALATAIVLLQASFMLAAPSAHLPSLAALTHIVPKFLGGILLGNLGAGTAVSWLAGGALAAVVALWLRLDTAQRGRWTLLYLLAGAIALSAVRIDPAYLTFSAGPRYFFYPAVLVAWILIQLFYARVPSFWRGTAAVLAALALVNLLPVVTRLHSDLQWQAHVRSCRLFPEYRIPVEVDGLQAMPGWELRLSGESCSTLLRRDLLLSLPAPLLSLHVPLQSFEEMEREPTFAYTVQRVDWMQHADSPELLSNTMTNHDFPRSAAPHYRTISSFGDEGATGELRLRMRRGESLLYRAGRDKSGQRIEIEGQRQFLTDVPAVNVWVRLTFSNSGLPAEFVVRIRDDGTGREQWSAVAVPPP